MPLELEGEVEIRQGKWEESEDQRYFQALKLYGKNWEKIQNFVKTRDCRHIRSHSQKLIVRLQRCISGGCDLMKEGCDLQC